MSILIRRKYPDDPASRYWLIINGEPVLDCRDFATALHYAPRWRK
jgi:hypothetical protein